MWALWSKFLKRLWSEVWKGWLQNWCRFWTSLVCNLMLCCYLSPSFHFYSNLLWSYCDRTVPTWQQQVCVIHLCYTYILGIHTKGKSFASVSLDPFLECRTNFWAFGSGQQQTLGRFFLWVWLTHLLTWLRLWDKLTQKSLLCLLLARQLLKTFSLCKIVL